MFEMTNVSGPTVHSVSEIPDKVHFGTDGAKDHLPSNSPGMTVLGRDHIHQSLGIDMINIGETGRFHPTQMIKTFPTLIKQVKTKIRLTIGWNNYSALLICAKFPQFFTFTILNKRRWRTQWGLYNSLHFLNFPNVSMHRAQPPCEPKSESLKDHNLNLKL